MISEDNMLSRDNVILTDIAYELEVFQEKIQTKDENWEADIKASIGHVLYLYKELGDKKKLEKLSNVGMSILQAILITSNL